MVLPYPPLIHQFPYNWSRHVWVKSWYLPLAWVWTIWFFKHPPFRSMEDSVWLITLWAHLSWYEFMWYWWGLKFLEVINVYENVIECTLFTFSYLITILFMDQAFYLIYLGIIVISGLVVGLNIFVEIYLSISTSL